MEIIKTFIEVEEVEEVGPGGPGCWAGCPVLCAATGGFGTIGSILVAGGLL